MMKRDVHTIKSGLLIKVAGDLDFHADVTLFVPLAYSCIYSNTGNTIACLLGFVPRNGNSRESA